MDASQAQERKLDSVAHPPFKFETPSTPFNDSCHESGCLGNSISGTSEQGCKVCLEDVKMQVDSCLKRHDQAYVFEKFKERAQFFTHGLKLGTLGISKAEFTAVVNELGVKPSSSMADDVYAVWDSDKDGYLNSVEFQSAVQSLYSDQVEQWVSNFPLNYILASAFSPVVAAYTTPERTDPLLALSTCSRGDLEVVLHGFLHGIQSLLQERVEGLRESYAAMDGKQSDANTSLQDSKFAVNTMSSGDIHSFFDGLGERVGE
jgi:hypothetical protein